MTSYSTGTISVSGTTVTGAGTGWTNDVARVGDAIYLFDSGNLQGPLIVETIDYGAQSITLERAGPTVNGSAYFILGFAAFPRIYAASQSLNALISRYDTEAFTQLTDHENRITALEGGGGGGGGGSTAALLSRPTYAIALSEAGSLTSGQKLFVEADEQNDGNPSLYTVSGSSLVLNRVLTPLALLNALDGRVETLEQGGGGGGAAINDSTISTASVWSSSETNTRINSAVSGVTASSNSARTFESFSGVTSVDHQSGATTLAQRQANDAALISARDWCRDTGGIVTFLGRKYAFDATFTGHSYTNFMGSGWNQTHLVWPAGQHAIECQSASGDSSYGITLSHLQIGNETWNHNQSEAAASQYSAINITGRSSGPNDAEAYAREGVGYLSDPYHRFFFVCVQEFDGNGFSLAGRGEIDVSHCIVRRTSGYGIDTTAPDLWITHNTVSETGLSGLRMNSGNVTSSNNKYWFNGKLKQETVGAGMEFVGSGKGNVTSTNDRIQDTWGPGLQIAGSHFNFVGLNITEPAGGRVESQGDGFEGTRGQPRCAIRFENAKNCRIQGTVQNQNYQGSGSGDYPYLVYHADSGGRGNMVDLACELGDNWRDTLEVAGWTNADRWSRVIYNGDELLGQVPLSALNDPTHGINESGGKYGPGAGVNVSDGANSGYAFRDGGTWQFMQRTASYTP